MFYIVHVVMKIPNVLGTQGKNLNSLYIKMKKFYVIITFIIFLLALSLGALTTLSGGHGGSVADIIAETLTINSDSRLPRSTPSAASNS